MSTSKSLGRFSLLQEIFKALLRKGTYPMWCSFGMRGETSSSWSESTSPLLPQGNQGNLLHFLDPDIAKSDILTMFLEL